MDMENSEPQCTTGRNVKWCSLYEKKSMVFPKKQLKME